MPNYPYDEIGTRLDREFVAGLNKNFDEVEQDVREVTEPLKAVLDGEFDNAALATEFEARANEKLEEIQPEFYQFQQNTTAQLALKTDKGEMDKAKLDLDFTKKQTTAPLLDLSKSLNETTLNVTTSSTEHLAFPAIGYHLGKYIQVYRRGSAHASFDGKLVYKTSTDGYTWSVEKVLFESTGIDYRDPTLLVFNGVLVMKYFIRSETQGNSTQLTSSVDGVTWSTPVRVSSPENKTNASRGNMVTRNGRLYMINYISKVDEIDSTYIVSTSDLINFSTPTFLKEKSNEASIEYSTAINKFVCVLRQQKESNQINDYGLPLIWGTSSDATNWDFTEMTISGQAPTIKVVNRAGTSSGNGQYIILNYRDTSEIANVGRFTFNQTLLNADGLVISKLYNLVESTSYDIGYGDILIMGTTILVPYYTVIDGTSSIILKIFNRHELVRYSATSSQKMNYRYLNPDNTVSKGVVEKLIFGVATISGDGTSKKSFTIDLTPLNIKAPYTIRVPNVVAVHSSGNFQVTVTNFNENTISGILRDVTGGVFSTDITVHWSAHQTTYSELERS